MIHRAAHPDFSERERALLNTIYPHLTQAFRNTASLTRFHRDVNALMEKLEGPTSSVIVLSGSGRVKRWSEQARTWIAQYCKTPFPVREDRLPDCFAEWYRRQLAVIAQETLSPSPREPLIVEKNGRQLLVQLIPDHFRDEHLMLLSENLGWCHESRLVSSPHGRQHRSRRYSGLARTDVSLDQPVHGATACHICEDLFDDSLLRCCEIEWKHLVSL